MNLIAINLADYFVTTMAFISTCIGLYYLIEAIWCRLLYMVNLKISWNGKVYFRARTYLFDAVIQRALYKGLGYTLAALMLSYHFKTLSWLTN